MLLNDRNSNIVFNFKVRPQAILGILNSRLTTYWFAYTFDKFQRGVFPQFKLAELAQFPIPRNIEQYEDQLVELVDSLTESGNARAQVLLGAINYLEASYGLSERDITEALIENRWPLLNGQLTAMSLHEREKVFSYFSTKQVEISGAQKVMDELDTQVDDLVFTMFGLDSDQRSRILNWE
jgi:hypothetical protein